MDWMDGWMGGWMDICMYVWVDSCMDRQMVEWMDGWMDLCMDRQMVEWMDGWMQDPRLPGVDELLGAHLAWPECVLSPDAHLPSQPIVPDAKDARTLAPGDDGLLLSQGFWSLHTAVSLRVPEYWEWLMKQASTAAPYGLHKKFLEHLEWQRPVSPQGRWLLASPSHMLALDAMLEAYPDAHVVYVKG
jgi:hypothetical protein